MNIKKLRQKNNLTRKEFSQLIGCSMNTLSNWENKKTTPQEHFIYKINKKFNMQLDRTIYNGSNYEELVNKAINNMIKNKENLTIKNVKQYSKLPINDINKLFGNEYGLIIYVSNKYEYKIENDLFNLIKQKKNIRSLLNSIYVILYKNIFIINYMYDYEYISTTFIERIKLKINLLFKYYEKINLENIIFKDFIIDILNTYLKYNNTLTVYDLKSFVLKIISKRIIDL